MTSTTLTQPVRSSAWPVFGLLLLGAIPLTFGAIRLLQLAGIVENVMPEVSGEIGIVVALVAHILGAALYAILGAFQFSASIRRRWPKWHRISGRIALIGGLVVALSALWLTVLYASTTPAGSLLVCFRIAFASGLLASIVLGFAAIRRREFQRHREWMMRAYALALGAGTQMIVLSLAEMIMGGPPSELARTLLMGLAWSINLTVAETLIRRSRGVALRRIAV